MKHKTSLLTLVFILLFISCKNVHEKFVSSKSKDVEYVGRIGDKETHKEIYWSGSSVKIKFNGTSIGVVLEDEHGENYFNIIVDEEVASVLKPDSIKRSYTLASNLENGVHTVELFKRTEWTKGKTKFYGFQIDSDVKILDVEPKEKLIEFYGNSITAGYAVDDYSGNDSPDGTNTNNYNSYATITAKHFDANMSCIVRSGIGITVSWFPMIMDEMYYRLDPSNENSHWDFSKSIPDIVVINLFQNDSWIVNLPDNEQFKNRFGIKVPTKDFIITSYRKFVQTIRNKYPNSKIICMLGNMDITKEDSVWPSYVEEAVSEINDKNIYSLFVPYKNSDGHPRREEQKLLADRLIKFIDKNIKW